MKNVLQTITKSVLIPSKLAAASAADARIHKKIYWIRDDKADNFE